MGVIDDIKSRIDIVELVSETVKLRRSGRTYTGLCPFHAHKNNTPSFAIWPDSGTWKCFGQCNEGGDIFKFVMKRDGVDFSEALRVLAGRAGVELKPRTPAEMEQDDNLDHLRQLLESAATWYSHLLKNAAQAEAARQHLAKRGLTDKAVEMFQLGYALDAWDAALTYFTGKDYTRQDLLDTGLIVEREAEGGEVRSFDRFRDRIMIPVRDERGRMTGFQARALKPEGPGVGPKFMNSPQTALFDKGRTLFGLNLARQAIREQNQAIIVEGNLDAVAAHQAGFANVVSSQGTALTEHQLRLLKKYTKRIILALDADAAGDAATLRGLTVAREALDRELDYSFDPRGLVKTEGRLGADIRVMTLPPGLDPDDVINRDPDEWRRTVDAAESVVAYVIRVLTANRNLNDPKVKTEVAEAVLPLIDDIAQPIERDAYRQKLARVLKVDERALAVRRAQPRRRAPSGTAAPAETPAPRGTAEPLPDAEAAEAPTAPPRETSKQETFCLSALLQRPERVYKANRALQDLALPQLSPEDFENTEYQLLFRALTQALAQVELDSADYLRQHLDPALQPQWEALAGSPLETGNDEARTVEALTLAVVRLRRHLETEWLNELRFMAEDEGRQDEPGGMSYNQEIARHAGMLAQLDRAVARRPRRGESASFA
jgi:DNA primase